MDDADTCTCPSCADPRLWRPKDGFASPSGPTVSVTVPLPGEKSSWSWPTEYRDSYRIACEPSTGDPAVQSKDQTVPPEAVIGIVPRGRDWPKPGDTVLVGWEAAKGRATGSIPPFYPNASTVSGNRAFDPVSGHTASYDGARWDGLFGVPPVTEEEDRDTGRAHDLSPIQHDAAIYALSVIGFAISLALLVTTANPLNGVGAMLSLLVIVLEAGS